MVLVLKQNLKQILLVLKQNWKQMLHAISIFFYSTIMLLLHLIFFDP